MCPNCKSIVGSGQKECAVCGESVTSSASKSQPRGSVVDGETMRFAKAILARPYKFTIILLVANVFAFMLMWQMSGLPFSVSEPVPGGVLIPFGAKMNYFIRYMHEWWRFVTPIFLHVNFLHLMVNMYSLWIVGPYVERLYGSAKFIVFWVVTGVAGFVASYLTVRPGMSVGKIAAFLFKNVDHPSAGASGALFGLVGVLFVFGIKFRHELPEGFKRAFGTGMLPIIVINLFIGYLGRGFIDNSAHLGGLVSGALLALVVDYRRPGERSGIALTWQILQIAAIALVAVSFLKTAQHLRDPLPGQPPVPTVQLSDQSKKFVSYAQAINDAQEAFYFTLKEHNVTRVDSGLKALESVPPLDSKADELRDRLKGLLLKAKTLNTPAEGSATPAPEGFQKQQTEITADFGSWSKEYNTWLKTTGRSYVLDALTETAPSPK